MHESTHPKLRTALSLVAAAVLAGCSFIPTYERPVAPVADAYPTQGSNVGMQTAAPAMAWTSRY
jgi:multidrug efflux system outer membrane protein